MTNRFSLTLGAMFLLSGAALAQGPEGGFGGPPPGGQQGGFGGGPQGGGFGGGRGGQRGGGPGGMMMNRPVTAASLSLRTMLTYLDLSDAQAVKIALAKEDAMESMRGPGGPRGGNNNAGDQKAVSAINALLSTAQKSRLATLVRGVAALQKEGIRPDAAAKLKLSDEQLTKLAQGASKDDVLTEDQVAVAAEFTMPQGGPGGFGGPGGPGGFGGGGFPGGEGGPGGPPPGGFGGV